MSEEKKPAPAPELPLAEDAQDVLAVDDLAPTPVSCPEWGRRVLIRPLRGYERGEWEQRVDAAKRANDGELPQFLREKLVVAAAVRPNGEPLFTVDNVKALSQKHAAPIGRLSDFVLDNSGMTKKAVEEAAKN